MFFVIAIPFDLSYPAILMLTAASSSSSSSMPRMLRDYSIFDETDEGIVVVDDDDDDCDESVDYAAALCNTTDTTMEHGSAEATTDGDPTEDQQRDDTDKRSSLLQQPVPGTGSSSSMTGDFSLFRDFFLAAFSDGYYSNVRYSTSIYMTRSIISAASANCIPSADDCSGFFSHILHSSRVRVFPCSSFIDGVLRGHWRQ